MSDRLNDRARRMRCKHTSKTVTLTMPLDEAREIMRFLHYVETRRDSMFGNSVFVDSDISWTPRVLETALGRSEGADKLCRMN